MVNKIDEYILKIVNVISKNIDKSDENERGLLSQNILAQLRNLLEGVNLKIYSNKANIENIKIDYKSIQEANKFIKNKGKYRFLTDFHRFLQMSTSHYTYDEDSSERLMLKYHTYLIEIKTFLKKEYNLDILSNINKFPINLNRTSLEYYEKIAKEIEASPEGYVKKERYYIHKTRAFFVKNKIYYEITFTRAHDYVSKFDRITAFTKLRIPSNYAVKLSVSTSIIKMFNRKVSINIIKNWEVSIRPCELNNFAKIFKFHINIKSESAEYKRLMKFLTKTGLNLNEFVQEDDEYYNKIKSKILQRINPVFFNVLDKCRLLIQEKEKWHNVIRYLLYNMNNKVIKLQLYNRNGPDNLNLNYKCIPFDEMPLTTSLVNHNPKIYDLLNCIDYTSKEDELFARYIKNNAEIRGKLFTQEKKIKHFSSIDQLIERYNKKVYTKHENRKIKKYKGFIYIEGYKENIVYIVKKLKEFSNTGIKNYSKSVKNWLRKSSYQINCKKKREILIKLFEESQVALIYGYAGTGKSTMINHISTFFNKFKKLYLTVTNPALDNLNKKVSAQNCNFMTVNSFIKRKKPIYFDLLFIDESSTVSNNEMKQILKKVNPEKNLIILTGDTAQINSIRFGNWFNISERFLPGYAKFKLTKTYRTDNNDLLELWKNLRELKNITLEHLITKKFVAKLDESIFERQDDDEIILCLNYDGLYGINNINRFLQTNNPSKAVHWNDHIYKINDYILFNDINNGVKSRFGPSIHNNLKGKIVDIIEENDFIQFDIQIDKVLNESDIRGYDLELLDDNNPSTSIIRFKVNRSKGTDKDDDTDDTVVPFQIAYATSIHKAQGLEYNVVKIVITDEIEEKITHNILYTAITRAKKQLKIYWSPETEEKILAQLRVSNAERKLNMNQDYSLLKNFVDE